MEIKQLQMINFKCFKNKIIRFGKTSNIYGKNGTGKSSVADAHFWLLYGKDSEDKENFTIKPMDKDGKTDPDAVTEVVGIFEYGRGEEIELKRTLEENWVIPKGEIEAVFRGNTSKRYINGVEVGVSEYDNKIIELTGDPVITGAGKKTNKISKYKLISSPKYFNETLHWTDRSQILFNIAPPISDEDIVKSDSRLSGMEEILKIGIDLYTAQETPKIKELQKEIDGIPGKITENQRNMPEALDFDAIEREIGVKEKSVAEYDKQLFDISAVFENYKVRQREVFSLESRIATIDNARKAEIQAAHNDRHAKIELLKRELDQYKQYYQSSHSTLESAEKRLTNLENQLAEKRRAHNLLKAQTFAPPDRDNFICPACKRPLEPSDIDAEIEKLYKNFKDDHDNKVKQSKQDGLALKAEINNQVRFVQGLKEKSELDKSRIESLEAQISTTEQEEIQIPAFDDTLRDELVKKLEAKKSALDEPQTNKDDIVATKKRLITEIDSLKAQLHTKEQIRTLQARNDQLKALQKDLVAQKANIEKMLYKCQLFTKIKVSLLEDNLSGMFAHTKIKLIDVNEKGVESECCTATLNGINYNDVNTAGKAIINLDVANVLSKAFGVTAPVFFDNREGVNNLIPTDLQTVNLFVTKEDEKLRTEVF